MLYVSWFNLISRFIIINIIIIIIIIERGSVVSIVTGYGMDDREVWSVRSGKVKNFDFSIWSTLGPTQPHIQWVPVPGV
jgi:hypothetical protein